MISKIHHAALCVRDFDWYVDFFGRVFQMTVQRTSGEAPRRMLWFEQGIQINEMADGAEQPGNICDHISLGTDIDPEEAAALAIENGCRRAEGKGAHWFELPCGVRIEMKPLG